MIINLVMEKVCWLIHHLQQVMEKRVKLFQKTTQEKVSSPYIEVDLERQENHMEK